MSNLSVKVASLGILLLIGQLWASAHLIRDKEQQQKQQQQQQHRQQPPQWGSSISQAIESTVESWQSLCEVACSVGFSGPGCGVQCNPNCQNDADINTTNRFYHACPMLCLNDLGDSKCFCTPIQKSSPLNVDLKRNLLCNFFCRQFNEPLYGCSPCRSSSETPPNVTDATFTTIHPTTKGLSDMNSSPKTTQSTEITPDWGQLCNSLCKTGDGGALCNCDRPPLDFM